MPDFNVFPWTLVAIAMTLLNRIHTVLVYVLFTVRLGLENIYPKAGSSFKYNPHVVRDT